MTSTGIIWGSERQGALADSVGATHDDPAIDPGSAACFCQFCQKKAAERGINVERSRQGFHELEKFVPAPRGGKRRVDGYYVQFWRLLLRYPEPVAWEMFWTDSLRETYQAIYNTVKAARATVPVGWHIWHNNSFQSDLPRRAGSSRDVKVLGLPQARDVQQLRRRAYGALRRQHRLYALRGSLEAEPARVQLRGHEP